VIIIYIHLYSTLLLANKHDDDDDDDHTSLIAVSFLNTDGETEAQSSAFINASFQAAEHRRRCWAIRECVMCSSDWQADYWRWSGALSDVTPAEVGGLRRPPTTDATNTIRLEFDKAVSGTNDGSFQLFSFAQSTH